jgi:hypothetical protein
MALTSRADYDFKRDLYSSKSQRLIAMETTKRVGSHVLGLLGAAAGGVLGYYIFMWIVKQGFYGLMIPGAILGLGCGLLSQHPSIYRGVVCAAAAIMLGLYAEWRFAPFKADDSFQYLIGHAADLKPVTQLMIILGACFAYWLGKDGSPRLAFFRTGKLLAGDPKRELSNRT